MNRKYSAWEFTCNIAVLQHCVVFEIFCKQVFLWMDDSVPGGEREAIKDIVIIFDKLLSHSANLALIRGISAWMDRLRGLSFTSRKGFTPHLEFCPGMNLDLGY